MKKVSLIFVLCMLFLGCGMNPSKEERIQKLETDLLQTIDQIEQLEARLQTLEKSNTELRAKVELTMEK